MKSVIIYRLGSMGDTLVSLPCFHKIQSVYPHHKKIALTNLPVSSHAIHMGKLLIPAGLIDEVIDYPIATRSIKDFINIYKKIKKTKAKTLIYLSSPRSKISIIRDYLFFRICGLSDIIGLPLKDELFNNKIDQTFGFVEPESERLVRTIKKLGQIDLRENKFWDLKITDLEFQIAKMRLMPFNGLPFFAINMGGKDPQKDWGIQNWIRLITELSKINDGYIGLVIIGSTEDGERARKVEKFWPFLSLNICENIDPRVVAAILSHAKYFIGHDSGPMHLAATVQTQCIALFGNLNKPNKWHPYGKSHIVIHDSKGVMGISVEMVLNAVKTLTLIKEDKYVN